MILEIKPGEEFVKAYDGFYLTSSPEQVRNWEAGTEIPITEYRISGKRFPPGSQTTNTTRGSYWVWRKGYEFKENEFGVECP